MAKSYRKISNLQQESQPLHMPEHLLPDLPASDLPRSRHNWLQSLPLVQDQWTKNCWPRICQKRDEKFGFTWDIINDVTTSCYIIPFLNQPVLFNQNQFLVTRWHYFNLDMKYYVQPTIYYVELVFVNFWLGCMNTANLVWGCKCSILH